MKPLNAIYWFNSANILVWSLIGVFIPVYLLKLGHSLQELIVFFLIDSAAVFIYPPEY